MCRGRRGGAFVLVGGWPIHLLGVPGVGVRSEKPQRSLGGSARLENEFNELQVIGACLSGKWTVRREVGATTRPLTLTHTWGSRGPGGTADKGRSLPVLARGRWWPPWGRRGRGL